jgi:hypothetical protein
MTHTKGPWNINKDCSEKSGRPCVHSEIFHIAEMLWMSDETEDNARLIAAAPELLEACKTALANMENLPWEHQSPSTMDLLHAAIAKAEGNQP